VPGESLDQVEGELQGLVDRLGRDDSDFKGTWRTVAARSPFEISPAEEIVGLVQSHGAAGDPVGMTYWADSALIAERLIPTVLFGPGGEGAHAQVEWVSIADVERCADVYLSVATEFCA
jgi:acetylornithine deacetylase